MITFLAWKWSQPGYRVTYKAEHVNVWCRMLRRHYQKPMRLLCVTDDPAGITECETFPLWPDHRNIVNPNGDQLPRCYARLKMFDAATTESMGIPINTRVASLDLDVVLLRDISPVFDRDERFVGWKGPGNASRPTFYNGSLMLFRAGQLQRIWDSFDPASSPAKARAANYFGSDQGWISYVLRGGAPGWGTPDGVYSYKSHVINKDFPTAPRLISFNGKHKPWQRAVQAQSPWILQHWR